MDRFFLSDVHLFPEPEFHPGRERFISFLDYLHDSFSPGELWILGDLFDFWFEYRSVVPSGYERCISSLRKLTDRGWVFHFIPGNHDFWTGKHFIEATGALIHSNEYLIVDLDGKRVLLSHGDGLGPGDTGYKLMKPVLRSAISRFIFSLLHPDLGTFIARRFSDTSKRILRRDLDRIPSGMQKWINSKFEEGIDIIITGHTHLNTVIRRNKSIYVSLGDWLTRFTYCYIKDCTEEPELLEYPCDTPE
ncbi:MAG: UDP-2,3-diacylglucosamine diphosphatase [Candidatus Aegiribacteria sp.]|nr:UDP-2,3-diacylglucosamine diphosphatase [Candidatus Aegiribacteria sp.]